MSENRNGKWGKVALMAALAAWLIYSIASAAEPPGQALMILQWLLLAGLVIGLTSELVRLVSQK